MPRFSYPFSLRTQTLSYIVYSPRSSEGVCCCLGYFTGSVGISNLRAICRFRESTTECCKLNFEFIRAKQMDYKWAMDTAPTNTELHSGKNWDRRSCVVPLVPRARRDNYNSSILDVYMWSSRRRAWFLLVIT